MWIWIAVMELKSCHQVILLLDTNEVHRNADCHSNLSNQTRPNQTESNRIKCNRIVSILPTFASTKKSDLFNTIVCCQCMLLYNFDSSINSSFNAFNALLSWAFKLKAKCYLTEKFLRLFLFFIKRCNLCNANRIIRKLFFENKMTENHQKFAA